MKFELIDSKQWLGCFAVDNRPLQQGYFYFILQFNKNDWSTYFTLYGTEDKFVHRDEFAKSWLDKFKYIAKTNLPKYVYAINTESNKRHKVFTIDKEAMENINEWIYKTFPDFYTDKAPFYDKNKVDFLVAIAKKVEKLLNSEQMSTAVNNVVRQATDSATKKLDEKKLNLEKAIEEYKKTFEVVDNEYQILNRKDVDGKEYVLFPHQKEGADFLLSRKKALLDYGTGMSKTITSLLACNYLDKKILIICEKKLKPYWVNEARMQEVKADVIHYQQIHKIIKTIKEGKKVSYQFIKRNPFGLRKENYSAFILDESHLLANFTKVGTSILVLFKMFGGYKFSLTATPYRNNLDDYLYQMKLLDHPVGNLKKSEFRDMFKTNLKGRPPNLELFQSMCKDVILTKTMEDIGINFDIKISTVELELDDYTKREYQKIKDKAREVDISTNSGFLRINTAVMALQYLTSKFKVDWTSDFLKSRKDLKTLVVSNYNKEVLDKIGENLETEVFKATLTNKEDYIKDFSEGDSSFFLAQRKIGQTGLNMQITDTLVLHDLHWSLDSFIQSLGRIKRMNQKAKTLYVIIPVVKNTIEQRVMSVIIKKLNEYMSITNNKAGIFKDFASSQKMVETDSMIKKIKYDEIMN